ncbi:hypothetical protein BJX68DRAFT_268572 [Aspergillus pseudodeflectus]|uniref:Uncharacterized protein n=1 Tax=Aspergillus pseudodeflectus TaxID=176178 RepID=A0ABR4K396_9EURO
MSLVPQLQWSLTETAKGAYIIARGILQAATIENVQALPMAACEKFGATLAMRPETCSQVEKRVFPTKRHWLITYLRTVVGYSDDDCASQLRKTAAGVQFLGLACALSNSVPLFEAAAAIRGMLEATNGGDKVQIPSGDHLRDYLAALVPRCSFAGFGEILVGHRSRIGQALAPYEYRPFEYETQGFPSSGAIKDIVEAFRDIGRIGDNEIRGIQIRACKCAPWIAAFTEWCLECPSIYLQLNDKRNLSILESPGSRVTIVIPTTVTEWDDTVHITRTREVAGPETLICPLPEGTGGAWTSMVNVRTYGQWLVGELGLDYPAERRRLQRFLPDAIIKVVGRLKFRPMDREMEELENLYPTPLPPLEDIKRVYGLMFDSPDPGSFRAIEQWLNMPVADLPEVETYLRGLEGTCQCNRCGDPNHPTRFNPPKCKKDAYFQVVAKIIADILTISLFREPESLLVETSPLRYFKNQQGLVGHIIPILKHGMETECDTRDLLASARILLGHRRTVKELGDTNNEWDWVVTCSKGQAFYPAIFDQDENYVVQRHGYLRLICLRGVLQREDSKWIGDTWKGILGAETTWADSQGIQALPGQVLAPDNRFRNLSAHWEVTKKDVSIMQAKIVIKDGQRRLQTTRNPIDSLMGLQYGLIAEGCHHEDPSRSLEEPARLCAYIGPDSAPSYRCPHHTVIVPVDGAHDLRFFCIPGREETRQFVLRQGACLQCALDICRTSMVEFLIL